MVRYFDGGFGLCLSHEQEKRHRERNHWGRGIDWTMKEAALGAPRIWGWICRFEEI